MSEVKRYMEFCGEGGGVAEHAEGGFVEFKDFDAVQAKNVELSEAHRVAQKQLGDLWKDLDAQRLRADTAEAERDGAKAANTVLREELRTERLRADAAVGDANEAERKLAALNLNPEAESHE